MASQKCHTEVVKLLLDKGADVNMKNKKDKTALMLASQVDSNDATSLSVVSDSRHTEVVKLLLAKGADVNTKNNKDITALMMASRAGLTETVKLLLDKGADVDKKGRC